MAPAWSPFHRSVENAIRATEEVPLLIDRRADGLSGLSGLKTVGLLQRLAGLFADDSGATYVEIGVFQGLTLVSTALAAPGLPCFGIDNFATLDPKGENLGVVKERLERFATPNATLINGDFETSLERLESLLGGKKVAVYFVDGPHDYRSQLVCLLLAKPLLHRNAVVVIDDANYQDVRWSTRDFLNGHPEFKLLFEAYTPAHPANMTEKQKRIHEPGWLNGIQVLVPDPEGLLPVMLPPVDPSERAIYLNEWLVHRLRMAALAPEAVAVADAVCAGGGVERDAAGEKLANAWAKEKKRLLALHPDRNTGSAKLAGRRFNPGLV